MTHVENDWSTKISDHLKGSDTARVQKILEDCLGFAPHEIKRKHRDEVRATLKEQDWVRPTDYGRPWTRLTEEQIAERNFRQSVEYAHLMEACERCAEQARCHAAEEGNPDLFYERYVQLTNEVLRLAGYQEMTAH